MPFADSEYPSILRGRDKRESQRLLAAAPELLAACKEMAEILQSMSEGGAGVSEGFAAPYLEIICKAEGRE
jgi:hypothetical protein